MKKALLTLILMIAVCALIWASTFKVVGSAAVTVNDQYGNYSTLTKAGAQLRWACRIEIDKIARNCTIVFVLKEEGKDVRLSTLTSSSSNYTVSFLFDNGTKQSYTGRVTKNNGIYNAITVNIGSDYSLFFDTNNIKVTISGNNATYNLVKVDITELRSIFEPSIPEGSCGGFIFYDKGYYSDGWRYLEAAPADIRVIDGIPSVNKNAIGYYIADAGYPFGYYRKANGINLFADGSASKYDITNATGTAIGTGKKNTELLVKAMKDETWSSPQVDYVTWFYAAKLCYDLVYEVDGKIYDDWFLPSEDELYLMYTNLHKNGIGGFDTGGFYWSSSEENTYDASYAWPLSFSNGYKGQGRTRERYNEYKVRPVRAF